MFWLSHDFSPTRLSSSHSHRVSRQPEDHVFAMFILLKDALLRNAHEEETRPPPTDKPDWMPASPAGSQETMFLLSTMAIGCGLDRPLQNLLAGRQARLDEQRQGKLGKRAIVNMPSPAGATPGRHPRMIRRSRRHRNLEPIEGWANSADTTLLDRLICCSGPRGMPP